MKSSHGIAAALLAAAALAAAAARAGEAAGHADDARGRLVKIGRGGSAGTWIGADDRYGKAGNRTNVNIVSPT